MVNYPSPFLFVGQVVGQILLFSVYMVYVIYISSQHTSEPSVAIKH